MRFLSTVGAGWTTVPAGLVNGAASPVACVPCVVDATLGAKCRAMVGLLLALNVLRKRTAP